MKAPYKNARNMSGRYMALSDIGSARLASDRCTGNTANIGPIDAKVLQFTTRHAAKLGHGLMKFAPVVEGACYVHNNSLFRGWLTSATFLGPGVVSMIGI